MVATLCLFSCVLATAQDGERPQGNNPPPLFAPAGRDNGNWTLAPHLTRAQELVYRGTFDEEASSSGVQFSRFYRLECRVFVLDAPPRGLDVAFLTILRARSAAERGGEQAPGSVRLEPAQVDGQGHVTPEGRRSFAVPLEGPPTVECGAFVEMPAHRLRAEQTWEVSETGRPARTWRVAGSDMVNGTSCLKLVGVQQSDDWDLSRADRTAWRRTDTVWVSPRLGIAYRVERIVERRDPARRDPNHKAVLRYELESSLPYPRQLYEDRRDEILQAEAFHERAAPLLAHPGKESAAKLEALLAKIKHHIEHQPPTPYREAVLQVQRRLEAAQRGEASPVAVDEESETRPTVASLGNPAPDFLATDFTRRETARLQNWLGKPVVLIFYSPTSFKAEELLRFAQELSDTHKGAIAVLGMAVSDDAERIRRQRDELRLTLPLLNGTGLRKSYEVEATPKVMLLDSQGIVRGSWVGWGQEAPAAVVEELKKWLSPRKP